MNMNTLKEALAVRDLTSLRWKLIMIPLPHIILLHGLKIYVHNRQTPPGSRGLSVYPGKQTEQLT